MKRMVILLAMATGIAYAQAVNPDKGIREERKILEIEKIVKLTPNQRSTLANGYKEYLEALDSSVYKISDADIAVSVKYKANKAFHELLMSTLKDKQRIEYIQKTSKPEIEEKASYKMSLLAESGEYSEAELQKMKEEIFNYLMLEKVVYVRDKFNVRKQKENISRLKNLQPRSLKESNIREKQKGQGRIKNGKIQW